MIGRTLAHYRVEGSLGAGGMGEVYRALDLRLGREVAIKTLPEEFARDPGRRARFEHEARTLAALSHPRIAGLYGLEEAEGVRFLVMELVGGVTLAERIARGPLPVEEALPLAAQIAEALEAAHEKGIVHRDLKPANIKVTPEGSIKVLDFGLAKALAEDGDPVSRSLSPTLTAAATRAGVILGTAAYMSPEQARGRTIDRRTDVWAFGCVLYEMLTGRQAFGGETISDAISNVLTREPDWTALPESTPAAVRRLLRRCLEKKAERRLRDLGDARLEIEEATASGGAADQVWGSAGAAPGGSAARRGARLERLVIGALALVAVAAVAWAIRSGSEPPSPVDRRVRRLSVPLIGDPGAVGGRLYPALSRDGSRLAYRTTSGGTTQVALRSLDQPDATLVPGTEGATSITLSPDGRQAAFYSPDGISTVPLEGGPGFHVADTSISTHFVWTPDGNLIYTPAYDGGLSLVPAAGGTPVALTEPDAASGELGHWHAALLPDGRSVLFTVYRRGGPSASQIDLVDLKTRARRRIIDGGFDARYASSGHLLFARGDTLYAVPFDAVENRLAGEPLPVLEGVQVDAFNVVAHYDIADDGTLVYVPSGPFSNCRLVWREPDGTKRPIVPEARPYMYPRLSPDGRTIAVSIFERGEADLWLADVERGVLSRLTRRPETEFLPTWSPDGRRIAFIADDRTYTVMAMPADGSAPPETLLQTANDLLLGSWTPDGSGLVIAESAAGGKNDLQLLTLLPTKQVRTIFETPAQESNPQISPDGRRVVFTSDELGPIEVYVGALDGTGGKTRVSTGGGVEPIWAPDGKSILYRAGDAMMSVVLGPGPDPRPQSPVVLFNDPRWPPGWSSHPNYDVCRDGRRFVMVENMEAGQTSLQVVLNFTEELKRRLPAGAR